MEVINATIVGNSVPNNDSYECDTSCAQPMSNQNQNCGDTADTTNDFAKQFQDIFNKFSEEIPNESGEAKKAKGWFRSFMRYVSSPQFENDVNAKAQKYHVPPKQVAKNFFLKVLGILGDVLGIVINTVGNVADIFINVLSTIAHGVVDVVVKAGNALARVVSFNQTATA